MFELIHKQNIICFTQVLKVHIKDRLLSFSVMEITKFAQNDLILGKNENKIHCCTLEFKKKRLNAG